ncbi:uncharacterized protein LOC134820673 isoform X2 [Bolinopsis microptera]
MRTVRNELQAELLTQAWAKFYEMASKIVSDKPEFTSVHICEAPGGFICSLNHYLKRNHPEFQWNWFGMTLNPYFEGNTSKEMVDDDLFISKTYSNWYFGGDNSGNVMNSENIADLKKKVSAESTSPVLLVTADGSIDCQDNPNEQEATVAHLHYCETVSALNLLAPGGNFLLKGFTLFEHSTLCLTYLLVCLFEKVEVVKPLTSKSGNSETYTLCTGFRADVLSSDQLEALKQHHSLEGTDNAFFARSDIPEEFILKFKDCSKKFKNYQQQMIENNIRTFEHFPPPEKNKLFQIKKFAVEHYMKTVCKGLGPIPDDKRLVRDIYLNGTKLNTTAMLSSDGKKGSNRRQLAQSHSEKVQALSLTWFQRTVLPLLDPITDNAPDQNIGDKLMAKMGFTAGEGLGRDGSGMREAIQVKQLEEGRGLGYSANPINSAIVSSRDEVQWFESPGGREIVLSPVEGRRLSRVTNSRFLSVDTLEKLNEAQAESTVIHRSDLCDVAKSVHAFYALSAIPEAYSFSDIQLGYLNNLTSFVSKDNVGSDFSSSIEFHEYLEKRCTVKDSFECEENSLDLITFDTSSKESMLENLKNVLTLLKSGGNCILHCQRVQDRFTVSVVYILTRLFRRCSFIKTSVCCPHTPDMFFVAESFKSPDNEELLSSIQQCIDKLHEAAQNGRDIVEILSVSYLFQPDFYKFVSCPNEKVSLDAFDTIVDLEKMNHRNSFPSGKSNGFITKCISETQ